MNFQGKEVIVSRHAIERANSRRIVYPDQILQVIQCGKLEKFGKRLMKFTKRSKKGSIICICEEVENNIVVKTVERGC